MLQPYPISKSATASARLLANFIRNQYSDVIVNPTDYDRETRRKCKRAILRLSIMRHEPYHTTLDAFRR